jgi:hypothetical protein
MRALFDWLTARGVTQLTAIESVHVAAYIEQLQKARSAPCCRDNQGCSTLYSESI